MQTGLADHTQTPDTHHTTASAAGWDHPMWRQHLMKSHRNILPYGQTTSTALGSGSSSKTRGPLPLKNNASILPERNHNLLEQTMHVCSRVGANKAKQNEELALPNPLHAWCVKQRDCGNEELTSKLSVFNKWHLCLFACLFYRT